MRCYRYTPLSPGTQNGYIEQPIFGVFRGKPYRLRFWYGLGVNTATGAPGNCKLTLAAAGSYSTSNIIYVGGTPQGEYYLSDQTFTPSSDLRSSIRVDISCTATATVDILLDNFSLIDPLACT
ncbi:hypothetical protein CPLU01_07509 [Colletotrichum plurivorum]|uniref:Uncharacterized protein n=1 Tax=Colletotrichum plurivorum TaxID=2175906 RepID=A0A8H6KF69_9PEZI|nr:hypothetical protein CPLU01_07509 [Colletotrichum plurivorum]